MKLPGYICIAALLGTGSLFGQPLERSVSPSRQFLVYGTNAQLRGAVSETAEQVKAGLLSILHQPDNWKTPVVIHLQFPEANVPETPASALHFSQTGAGLKLQLDLIIAADVNAPEIQRELLRAILLERIYRRQIDIAPGTVYVQAPDWLLDGLLAARPGYGRAPLLNAVASWLVTNDVVPLDVFLRQRPSQLDSPARVLYRAHSLALVQLLLDGADGPARLSRYIDNLSAASNDPVADLRAQFPVFSSGDLANLWQANVKKLSTTQRYELLTFAETERELAQTLPVVVAGKTLPLERLVTARLSNAQKAAVHVTSEKLILLGTAAHPLMRPIVGEYQQITEMIVSGERKGLSERLARLQATRNKLTARMDHIDDYMNWFEATQSKTTSGVFVDYLRTAAGTAERQRRRRDAISVYLDSIEEQTRD